MMSLKGAAAAGSFSAPAAVFNANREFSSFSSYRPALKGFRMNNNRNGFVSMATTKGSNTETTLTAAAAAVPFHPFEEVQKFLSSVPLPSAPHESLARHEYVDNCEAAINEQINVCYNVSYVYHALYAYFDRDNVALKGFARRFRVSGLLERDNAQDLMSYQNKRGGKVILHSIVTPPSEFDHAEKGNALYAMEIALSLEKLVNEKLRNLHALANAHNDPEMAEFVQCDFMSRRVKSIKKYSEYVAQLRRVGKGHGVWHFDQKLLDE